MKKFIILYKLRSGEMKKIIILILFMLGVVGFSTEVTNKSIYTSTKDKDCKRPTGKFRNLYPYEEENVREIKIIVYSKFLNKEGNG